MIATLSLSALLLSCPAAVPQQQPVDTSELTAEMIVGHPGLLNGNVDSMRDDLLEALLNDRSSPLANVATHQALDLNDYGATRINPSVLARLIEGVHQGTASTNLRHLYFQELRRSRFQELSPQSLPERPSHGDDLYDNWFTNWRVLSPWGDLQHPTPLRAGTIPPDPRDKESLDPLNGQTRIWQQMLRNPNRTRISPDDYAWKHVGSGYAAIWVRTDPQVALLELHANSAMRAWWNGMPTFEDLREGLANQGDTHQAYVNVQAGWNLLLVQYQVGEDILLGGRLLSRDGRIIPYFEWEDINSSPELPMVPMPAETLDLPYWQPTGNDAWDVILRCVLALHHERPDIALATPEPTEMTPAQTAAWLHWQHRALAESYHLPTTVIRNRMMEIEARSTELSCNDLTLAFYAANRLQNEDKREEALTAARAIVSEHPEFYGARTLEAAILLELDGSGTLAKPALKALAKDFPHADWPLEQLQSIASNHGDRPTALDLAYARLTTSTDGGWDLVDMLLDGDAKQVAQARELLSRIEIEEPQHPNTKRLRRQLWRMDGKENNRLQELRAEVATAPHDIGAHWSLADYLLRHGQVAEATKAYENILSMDPSEEEALRLMQVLGRRNDASAFFQAFAPDVATQLAQRDNIAADNSTAMLLDCGMVYMLLDGGMIYRVHNLDLAMDRNGTEILHEMGVNGLPQIARVLTTDGEILEPHQVNGTLVMPSLDPGDVIETVFDRYVAGIHGSAGDPGFWQFSSFQQPFALSRWVIFVPEGAAGVLREQNFDGNHETQEWPGGKVHIFTRSNSDRLEPELLMPSELELLPWVAYGKDQPLEYTVEGWRDYFKWQSSLPADIELELREFLITLPQTGTNHEKAERIYAALTEMILDFEDDGDLIDVWTLKRGNPTYLLSTLYNLAGIPHEWSVLQTTAPELDEEPMDPFQSGENYQIPALRLADNGEEPTWIAILTRGTSFGDLPPAMLGASALILEGEDAYRIEEISREGLTELWDMDLTIAYSLGQSDDAAVVGSLTMRGVQGAGIREAISQLSPQEVDQALRQLSSQMVKGLDLNTAQVIDMDVTGGPLIVNFDGSIPGFVQRRGDKNGARLRIPELGLADGLGPAERTYPFVLRGTQRARVSVQLDTGMDWTIEYGPENSTEERDGFRYDFKVDKTAQHLLVRRTLEMRGTSIPATDFPGFIATMKELENQETRAVRLHEVIPVEEEISETSEEAAVNAEGRDEAVEDVTETVAKTVPVEEPAGDGN
ncbi:MAG: hypothetical protein GY747_11280 [Planctomycetes bacterium]|nr:hypothetical protein [Planctomycetota bacterium]MCP4861268.1 hypothetical protein [Planctomycetota bacterium]